MYVRRVHVLATEDHLAEFQANARVVEGRRY